MYWNNSWVNYFNKKNYFNKVLFVENIFYFLFSDKIFRFFFKNHINLFQKSNLFKKLSLKKKNKVKNLFFLIKKRKPTNRKKRKIRYNFTRLWFVKYNNYILLSTFVFFFFKVKRKKKKQVSIIKSKPPLILWRKKKGFNFKRKLFLPQLNKIF